MGSHRVAIAVVLAVALTVSSTASAARSRSADTARPTVDGAAYKGGTLTCTVPTADGSPVIAWLRDGAPIPGTTGTTYTVTGSDVGHQLACTATLPLAGVATTLISQPVAIVVVATAIGDRSARVQRGPTLTLRGQVSAEGPRRREPCRLSRSAVVATSPLRARPSTATAATC